MDLRKCSRSVVLWWYEGCTPSVRRNAWERRGIIERDFVYVCRCGFDYWVIRVQNRVAAVSIVHRESAHQVYQNLCRVCLLSFTCVATEAGCYDRVHRTSAVRTRGSVGFNPVQKLAVQQKIATTEPVSQKAQSFLLIPFSRQTNEELHINMYIWDKNNEEQ
jgi:hypothetical protein